MTSRRLLTVAVMIALCLSGLLFLGGCTGTTSPEEIAEILGGEAYSLPDGSVVIDMGDLGTFHVQFCDGLTGAGVQNVKCIAMVHRNKTDVVYVGMGDQTKMPRFAGRPKSDVLGDPGMLPAGCDDMYPWIGVDEPVTGIHSSYTMPDWAWGEFSCSRAELATDAVQSLDTGNIATALASYMPGLVLAAVFPPGSEEVIIFTCYAEATSLGELLADIKTSVYELQGYCPTQELTLVTLKGLCGGDIVLGAPLIVPVDAEPGCTTSELPGELYGFVYDANSGLGVEGASVVVNGVAATTDADGYYEVSGVIPGDGVPLTVSADGYLPHSMTVTVLAGGSSQQDITIVPVVDVDQFRFVLTWGEDPSDLDSHMWVPTAPGSYTEVYWIYKGSLVSAPYCTLDVDDVTGFGPETITVLPEYDDLYHYAIYEFSGDGTLATSDAVVRIYSGNSLIHTLNAPTTSCGENWWWHVGTLNAQTGVFNIDNTYHSTPPIGLIGRERATKK